MSLNFARIWTEIVKKTSKIVGICGKKRSVDHTHSKTLKMYQKVDFFLPKDPRGVAVLLEIKLMHD